MSKVVSLRLKDDQFKAAERAPARWAGSRRRRWRSCWRRRCANASSPSSSSATRPMDARHTKGTRLAVWHVAAVAHDLDDDVAQIAGHFGISVVQAKALLNYAAAYPEEIQAAIDDDDSITEEDLDASSPTRRSFGYDSPPDRDAHPRRPDATPPTIRTSTRPVARLARRRFRTADDDAIPTAAFTDRRIVVTDRKTFTPLLSLGRGGTPSRWRRSHLAPNVRADRCRRDAPRAHPTI